MEIEEALTAYLLAQAGLGALISNKFFFEEIPQGTTLPAVVCIKISDIKNHLLTEQDELERPIFQFTSFAQTKAAARNVLNQIKTALCDFNGTMSGIFIQKIEQQSEISNLETTSDGTTKVYTESAEFEINYIKE